MKNNLLKLYITVFYLFSTFVMFANPGDDDDSGTLEGDGDSTPMPIDDYVWVLAFLGLFLVFIKLKSIQNKEIANKKE